MCFNYNIFVAKYYVLSHFVTILNNYIMFLWECIGIFAKFWWKYLEYLKLSAIKQKAAVSNTRYLSRTLGEEVPADT